MTDWEYARDQLSEAHAHLLEAQLAILRAEPTTPVLRERLQKQVEALEHPLVEIIREIENTHEGERTVFGKPRRTLP